MKKNFLNEDLCEMCGGVCCKNMPGACLPEDFGEPLLENLKKAFATGNYAVDWWEGDPTGGKREDIDRGYFVRPKIKGVSKTYDPSYGGECIFLGENGCKLKPQERPYGCRMLETKSVGDCTVHAEKDKIAVEWIPFHSIIHSSTGEVWRE